MKEWIALCGLGAGLFVTALIGTLAVQGRLDHEGTRGIPVLAGLFEPPIDTGEYGGAADVRAPALRDGETTSRPRAADAPQQRSEPGPESDGLFEFPKLDSGFTAEDLERVLRAARETEERARLERTRVEAMEVELLARQRDLEDRESNIAAQMIRVDAERERLERRIADFERKVLLVERDALRGLREYAATLSAFEPERAASIVLEEWETEDGRKRIVKVLAVMDPEDANTILARIDRERVRDVLLERLKIVLEPRDGARDTGR